jgi:peptide/nickel transport system permease protein
MLRFLLRRFLILLLMLVVVSLVAFAIPYLGGGDPVRDIIRARVADYAIDPAAVEGLRVQLGLDRPLVEQYAGWLANVLRGDFGLSLASREPVGSMVGAGLLISAILAVASLLLALAVALPLGTAAALRPGGLLDRFVTLLTQALVALPEYWLAPAGILIFALYLRVLPSAGWDSPASLVLPVGVLSLRPMAYLTRVTRASMIDVLEAPYITAARSRGLGMGQTLLRHGLRNGILPVVTLLALWLAGLLGGSVVVEVIFAIPGMGRLMYEAVLDKDVPLLQTGLICIVGLAVLINTATDLLYLAINPVLRSGNAGR